MRALLGIITMCLLGALILLSSDLSAQTTQPHAGQSREEWRQAWFDYEREIKEWCAKNLETMGTHCVQNEMAKHGVSPAFFVQLHAEAATKSPAISITSEAPTQHSPNSYQKKIQRRAAEARQISERIAGYALPRKYKQIIDAYFVEILKDPDSRKIEYKSNPYGSLICGTINARNSYGGYTGKQPFYAYFDGTQRLKLRTFSEMDLGTLAKLAEDDLLLEEDHGTTEPEKLLRDCGF